MKQSIQQSIQLFRKAAYDLYKAYQYQYIAYRYARQIKINSLTR